MNITNGERLNTVLLGVSGEYFVATELSKRGYIASITLRNTKGVDVLCSNSEASKTVGIQVKTNSGSNRSWILNQKAEDYFADNLFYVFVNLNNNKKHPDFFVISSKIVAKYICSGGCVIRNLHGLHSKDIEEIDPYQCKLIKALLKDAILRIYKNSVKKNNGKNKTA